MAEILHCDICSRHIELPESYVVRIDVFADPSMPPMSSEEIAKLDFDATLQGLLDEMKNLSAEELQDQVHRRFEYRLCRLCHLRFLANPLGKPRGGQAMGTN